VVATILHTQEACECRWRCKDVKDRKACMQDPKVAGFSRGEIRTAQRHFVTSSCSSSPYKYLDVPEIKVHWQVASWENKGRVRIGVTLLGIELNLGGGVGRARRRHFGDYDCDYD
jgi:hypothetical protein